MLRNFSVIIGLLLGLMSFAVNAHAASEAVRCVQNELNELGYDAGIADGLFGPRTSQAGEQYRQYMSSTYSGWATSKLTKRNADDWCKQVASANPAVQKYHTEYIFGDSEGAILTIRSVAVDETLEVGVPYDVVIDYKVVGNAPFKVEAACFTWNADGPYCFQANVDTAQKRVTLSLVTGNPNKYNLNGALRYSVDGEDYMSSQYTSFIDVQ